MTPAPITRRRALVLGGLGAAGVVAGATGWIVSAAADPATAAFQPGATGAELLQPPVLDSRAGRLSVELTAAAGARVAGHDTSALGFNGGSPGPTLRVRPGDELAVRLTNRLDQPTNLHTHGLRVSPQGSSDNPFVRVEPGASFDYLYRIPADHPAGTHWYHPHHHGTVADQLFGGLAGALIVDRGPDIPAATDRLLLITDITLDAGGTLVPTSAADRSTGREGRLVLVNGQHQPTITTPPGATERWRIVNACTSRVHSLRLDGHPLIQIAQDGSFLNGPTSRDTLVLAPGNRADIVVQPRDTGRFALIADPYDRGSMMGAATGGAGPVTLATMVTSGPPHTAASLPVVLPAESPAATPVTRIRRTTFQMGMGSGMSGGGMSGGAMAVAIDGRTFDPARDDQTVTFGTTEEWTVTNASPLAHPFHLHVRPFTVIAAGDGRALTGTPQDVVLIPPHGWVRLRIPFTTFTGRSVYHCHILDHEDAGMMATVAVAWPPALGDRRRATQSPVSPTARSSSTFAGSCTASRGRTARAPPPGPPSDEPGAFMAAPGHRPGQPAPARCAGRARSRPAPRVTRGSADLTRRLDPTPRLHRRTGAAVGTPTPAPADLLATRPHPPPRPPDRAAATRLRAPAAPG